jgi:hypothetical protein
MLWVAASGEDWNSGSQLGVAAANGLTGSGAGCCCCWKSLPGFCFLLRLFSGLSILDLVSSTGDGLSVVKR